MTRLSWLLEISPLACPSEVKRFDSGKPDTGWDWSC